MLSLFEPPLTLPRTRTVAQKTAYRLLAQPEEALTNVFNERQNKKVGETKRQTQQKLDVNFTVYKKTGYQRRRGK